MPRTREDEDLVSASERDGEAEKGPTDHRVVVVNATPVITLATVDQLSLLQTLYTTVLIPSAVHREVLAGGPNRRGSQELIAAPWIQVTELEDPRRADLISDLDRGEAEVVALALERRADLVVIDERLGRRHATRLGLTVTGTLGILLKAKNLGLIRELSPLLEMIRRQGIWLSESLVQRALELSGEEPDG